MVRSAVLPDLFGGNGSSSCAFTGQANAAPTAQSTRPHPSAATLQLIRLLYLFFIIPLGFIHFFPAVVDVPFTCLQQMLVSTCFHLLAYNKPIPHMAYVVSCSIVGPTPLPCGK